jgi:hypothetical protein
MAGKRRNWPAIGEAGRRIASVPRETSSITNLRSVTTSISRVAAAASALNSWLLDFRAVTGGQDSARGSRRLVQEGRTERRICVQPR